MSVRYSTPLLVLCVALSAVVLASTAAAQAPTRDAGNWVVPRTADGHPDLQGNWTNATITRFQREEDKGPVLTWDEVAELEGRAVARVVRGAEPSDPNRAAPDVTGGVGTYNDFYWDRGKVVAIVNGEPRSSLLTNPPDGRRPPFTSEGEQRIAEYRALREQFGQYDNPENRPLGERCLMSFGSSAGPR